MDALGVDRPHALVLGSGSLFGIACGLELLDRGYEVHLPPALVPPPDLWPAHPERLHVLGPDRRSVEALLAHTAVGVCVLTGEPVDLDLAAVILTGMGRRAGGRMLVRGDGVEPLTRTSSVTVLTRSVGEQWLDRAGHGTTLSRHPDDDLSDALVVARRAVAALVARRPHVTPGLRRARSASLV